MTTDRITALTEAIVAAGVPIDGVGRNADGTLRIDYRPAATAQQRTDAETIAGTFDLRPHRRRSLKSIDDQIQTLTSTQQAAVRRAAVAWVARQSPEVRALIRNLTSDAVDIVPDEPEPST